MVPICVAEMAYDWVYYVNWAILVGPVVLNHHVWDLKKWGCNRLASQIGISEKMKNT